MNAPGATPPLLFSWSPPQRRYRALILFLAASLLLHAFCFYIFQIVYPPIVALLPAPARLNVISPDDPDSLALLRWVEAEDPALASTTQPPADYRPIALPRLEHIPSYAQHQPTLAAIPESPPDLSVPSAAAIGSIPRAHARIPLPLFSRKTGALFSDQDLGQPTFPHFTFHLSRPDAPANVRCRVAIDEAGAVRFCFLVESSGDPQLDEQARQFLLLCRFPPQQENAPLTWSMATILWGNDFAPPESTKLTP